MSAAETLDLANLPVGHFYPKPDLLSYQWLLINSSGGKDSQAMLDYLVSLADAADFPRSRIVVVHCDLGRAEWEGTAELAREQAEHYGLRFVIVKRDGTVFQGRVLGDLPAQVVERHQANIRNGKNVAELSPWPNRDNRWCTSDQKTSQVSKLITALCDEARQYKGQQIRVLNCLGLRAEESRDRAEKTEFGPEPKGNSGRRYVDRWLPIKGWSEEQVWDRIHASGVRYHWAYDRGMERLSCCFCVLASPKDWAISVKYNRALAEQYVEVERIVGHAFVEPQDKAPISMQDIIDAADRAEIAA